MRDDSFDTGAARKPSRKSRARGKPMIANFPEREGTTMRPSSGSWSVRARVAFIVVAGFVAWAVVLGAVSLLN